MLNSAVAFEAPSRVGEYAGAGESGSSSGDIGDMGCAGDVGAPHFGIGGALPTAVAVVTVVPPDSETGGTLPLAEYPAGDGPWGVWRRRRKRSQAIITKTMTATMPITMPAMAPPESESSSPLSFAFVWGNDVDESVGGGGSLTVEVASDEVVSEEVVVVDAGSVVDDSQISSPVVRVPLCWI